MTTLSVIAAVADNGVIGRDNSLPWHLPADLRRFRELTMGHPILMGRRTWESIGKPLPGRRSVVLSRQPDFEAPGGEVAPDLEAALGLTSDAEEVFVIGGAGLFAEALPRADRLYLTRVHASPEGDVCFPELDLERWSEAWRQPHGKDEKHVHPFTFYRYERHR